MLIRRKSTDSNKIGGGRGILGGRFVLPKPTCPSVTTTTATPTTTESCISSLCSSSPSASASAVTSACRTTTTVSTTSSKLFQPGVKVKIHRVSPFATTGFSSLLLEKKFQRPVLKRRAYNKEAEAALKRCSLGAKRRFDGMSKLLARAGRGLTYKLPDSGKNKDNENKDTDDEGESDEESVKEDRPFEPLMVWKSPHQGAEPKGLPSRVVTEMRPDEYGVEEEVKVIRPAPLTAYSSNDVFVPPVLAKWLRPHQREGVQFMYECVMSLRGFNGAGCILADDMGLGKTLQSVTLIYTLIKTGITADGLPSAKRVIVVCPCSLVKNWDNEFVKWLGPGAVKALAIAEADRKTVEKNLDTFVRTKMFQILIISYECLRTHIKRLAKYPDCCDLLVCDEAHRLKNSDNQTSRALNSLPVKRRVLLTGTPMQNDLIEFYAMVDFTNPGILGTPEEFRRKMLFPILRGREPDATETQKQKMMQIQNDMSRIVNDFILRRVNTLNAQHLPPKLVQVVCCNLTEIQQNMYQHLVNSKDMQHVLDGKQVNCLASIQMLMKLCNHPSLVAEEDQRYGPKSLVNNNKRSTAKTSSYNEDEKESTAAPGADGIAKFLPYTGGGGGRGDFAPVFPEWSGKMFVLYRLMKEMRKPGNGNDKIVIVSNYTQTLDLIGRMCRENNWGFCRLDGSITMKKRQKMVDEFNDPCTPLIAFLLSSKAGGCGLNLIGGNRLVLFDPDWNPAVDKQAAARCWRDGQKKRCFTYRFLATGTVEEKIFQRQLSKEGLQSVVDDKEQVNALSTKDLRNLFKLRSGTPSDTHDKLRCERCRIIQDTAEIEAKKVLPKKLKACRELLDEMSKMEDARFFLKPLIAAEHGRTKEEYEKLVKQPMDFETIRKRLAALPDSPNSYSSASGFSKDVNRIFGNILKVWEPGEEIADAARRLQAIWVDQWTLLVPRLMGMKSDDDEKRNDSEDEADNVKDILEACANVHNERGDDYQEQIGMPDEENMRHWSHHHNSDTVDDPVFRAAMRGFDTVSFVFGLEVTWSLIQQRQQDEEERQAMAELENMEDMDENNDEEESKPAAVDTNDVCEPSGGENEDDQDDMEEGVCGITNDNEQEDESDEDLTNLNITTDICMQGSDPQSYIEENELSDSDEDSSAENLLEEEITKKRKSNCSDTLEVQNVAHAKKPYATNNNSDNQSSPGKENTSVQVSAKWSCVACTFVNSKSAKKCKLCQTNRT